MPRSRQDCRESTVLYQNSVFFVGEQQTMEKYEAALNDAVKIGIKQGLAKGLAIGCTGVSFAIWAFLSWYASILVMYKGESGGDVFATGLSLINGGL